VIKLNGSIAGYLDILSCFYHEFTGRENIFLAGAYFGAQKRDLNEKMDRILSYADTSEHADTPIKSIHRACFFALHVPLNSSRS
jgi:ABC-type polysaccharide/polyol phosphate transport system ATPase subunit